MSAKNEDVNNPQLHNFLEESNNTCILEESNSDIIEEDEQE
jgi:hypothetical protein